MDPSTEVCSICRGNFKEKKLFGNDFLAIAQRKPSPEIPIRFCAQCGTGWTESLTAHESFENWYPSDYFSFHEIVHPIARKLRQWIFVRTARRLKKEMGGRGAVLEMGCGSGDFLFHLRSLGLEVCGIEKNLESRNWAKKHHDLSLFSDLREVPSGKQFQALVFWNSLEHIPNAALFLKEVSDRFLSPEGILLIKVPRLDSWEFFLFGKFWFDLELPRHRVHFTWRGMSLLLSQLGFQTLSSRAGIVPMDCERSFQNTLTGFFPKAWGDAVKKYARFLTLPVSTVLVFTLAPLGASRMTWFAKKIK